MKTGQRIIFADLLVFGFENIFQFSKSAGEAEISPASIHSLSVIYTPIFIGGRINPEQFEPRKSSTP